jgi:hypothetical protein
MKSVGKTTRDLSFEGLNCLAAHAFFISQFVDHCQQVVV